MTHPPQPPGRPGDHDATQAIPALGPAGPGPALPPPEHRGAPSTGGDDPTRVAGVPTGGAPLPPGPNPGPPPGYQPPPPGAVPTPAGPWAVPAAAAGPVPPRRTGRVLGRALAVLVVVGALAGTTAWGLVNRSSAEKWRDRAEAAEADLRTALDRVEATEADLVAAQERLRDLANQSAGETDRNRILAEVVAQAPAVTDALSDCQNRTADLANDLIAALGDPQPDLVDLRARTNTVNAVCADALGRARDLERQIDALGI